MSFPNASVARDGFAASGQAVRFSTRVIAGAASAATSGVVHIHARVAALVMFAMCLLCRWPDGLTGAGAGTKFWRMTLAKLFLNFMGGESMFSIMPE
jgi:hypothetical protein